MAFAGESGQTEVEAMDGTAGDGDFLFGDEVYFGLVLETGRIFGHGGDLVVDVVVFGGVETFGLPEVADEDFDEVLVLEAFGLPVGVELGLEFGELVIGLAGQFVTADGVEAVFVAGGLGTVEALRRLRAFGFGAVDPCGFGARGVRGMR
jgi:hypothetical protein